jgi:hypothetical protein
MPWYRYSPVAFSGLALDGERVLLGRHGDVVGAEAGDGERDPVVVLAGAFDVVGG